MGLLKAEKPAAIYQLKYSHILCCLYVGIVLVSITQASRLILINIPIISLKVFITGGTLSIPIAFFIQNIVTEVYGYTKSRNLIQVGLFIVTISIFYEYLLTFLPLVDEKSLLQEGYNTVFMSIPKHILAFICSSFVGSIINDYIISKTKIYFHGKYLRLRFICATAIGEAVYMFFAVFAWINYLSFQQLLPLLIVSYIYRLSFGGATLQLSYYLSVWLKESEKIDVYDCNLNYNPFLLFTTDRNKNE